MGCFMEYNSYHQDVISQELDQNEQILWSGQPNPNVYFAKGDLFLVPFALLWSGFAFSATFGTIVHGAPGLFTIMPALFCIVGLYITIGRFIYKRIRKLKTYYVLTNKRVLEIIMTRSRKTKEIYLSQMQGLNSTVNRNKRGSITFSNANFFQNFYANTGMDFGMNQQSGFPAFYDVDNVEVPLRILKQQRKNVHG